MAYIDDEELKLLLAVVEAAREYAVQMGAYSHGANCPMKLCGHRRMFEALAAFDKARQ